MLERPTLISTRRARALMLMGVAVALPVPLSALAQTPPPIVAGPPPDAAPIVAVPDKLGSAPTIDKAPNGTSVTLSAGGQLATGNSRLLAITGNGVYASRYGDNGFGASVVGNYGQGAPPGVGIVETSENIQGRIRYDRYVLDHMSLFLIGTGRHDKFQGLDFRLNIDPGLKYIFVDEKATSFWGEVGYDFQYDIRDSADLGVFTTVNGMNVPTLDPVTGLQVMLPRTQGDSSSRLFVGLRHAFNDAVTFSTGLEYLQSFLASDSHDYRLNYDALFAAKVGGGLSVGFAFTARYDHDPLPGKEQLDTTTSVNLIYGFSDLPKPPCTPCEAPIEPPPPPEPSPSAAPPPPAPPPSAAPPPAPAPTTPPTPPADATPPAPPAPAPSPAPHDNAGF